MRRSTTAAIAAASLLPLLLVGCSAGSETPAEPPEALAPTEGEASAPTDPACLIGDWRITQDQMQVFYDAVSASTEGLSLTIVGDTGLSFTEADYLYTPGFTLQLEVAGVSGEGVTTGSIGGTWTAADGIITTTVGDNSLSTIVTINGVTQDASSTIGAIIASDPINEAPFDCTDPSAPVLQFDTGSGRVPVALSAAG